MPFDTTLDSLAGYSAAGSDAGDRATFGPVHLDVTDAGRSLGFWRDAVGLQVRGDDGGAVRLGAGDRDLVVLHPGATGPQPRGYSGIYHPALHFPDVGEFARAVARVAAAKVPQGPTDHVMSLASYLRDPDGIELELTLETPHRMRSLRIGPRGPEIVDAAGQLRSGRDAIDTDWLLGRLPEGDPGRPLPPTTTVGHVHLYVGDLDAAVGFYRDVLGFTPEMHWPAGGAADLSAGGSFRHRLAVNTWQGVGAPQRPAGTAGLRHYTVVFRTEADLAAAVARAEARGQRAEQRDVGALVRDPAGNAVLLTAAA